MTVNPRYLPARPGGEAKSTDVVDSARHHADQARNGYVRLRRLIIGPLSDLFGDWVRGTFERPLEDAHDHAAEAFYSYAEALTERDERLASLGAAFDETCMALAHCAERLQARYAKARKPLPEDLAGIVVIAAAKSGWNWLFPPRDDRHVHDTDSGGNCRNPACSYNSDHHRNRGAVLAMETEQTVEAPSFDEWVILELMGHRRLAGKLTEQELGGGKFLRIDVPDGPTQFYGAGSVYCVTPTTEEIARKVAARSFAAPVSKFELAPPAEPVVSAIRYDEEPF